MNSFKSILLTTVVAGVSLLALSACDKCEGDNPRARVINQGTKDASVQIKTSNGNTENINNVPPKTTSAVREYAAGTVTFTITLDKTELVETVQMNECHEYDITIASDNTISTTDRDLND
ncbi:hypothetical protein [Nibribacter koreensis]|uniref:Uncharacterized protein n=1 Tax=Nibribacter koreensis TaxID=1084519 RepID=A0ABP8F5M1_9BACT